MAKAYWIAAYREIHDAEKLAAYLELAGPAIAAGGGKFLARGPAAKVYEAGIMERTTLIEFESLDAAVATHDSQAYQEALKLLGDGVTRDLRFAEGLE
ncbi:MAG: DUF1330 domain-containing protein [Proteobacteria bacterium]|nr:DUF1330 domain-containing protein [Pseudomonadota bacterium]